MKNIIERYYHSFNNADYQTMLGLLDESIEHEINQGSTQVGLDNFKKFLAHMDHCYKERLEDIVIMDAADGKHYSAEFIVNGEYLKTDGNLPPAHGQKYHLKAGTFFEVDKGKIKRVTTYYNLPLWIEMVK